MQTLSSYPIDSQNSTLFLGVSMFSVDGQSWPYLYPIGVNSSSGWTMVPPPPHLMPPLVFTLAGNYLYITAPLILSRTKSRDLKVYFPRAKFKRRNHHAGQSSRVELHNINNYNLFILYGLKSFAAQLWPQEAN